MKRFSMLLAALTFSTPLYASHPWGGVDLCQTRRDTVPPGIAPNFLPEPTSAGAALLQRYCTQCHNLPGPGRHTREEWPDVLARMGTLMQVSRFYRGLLGPVTLPNAQEQAELRAYLERNALRPLPPASALFTSRSRQIFVAACGDCHAAPDPRAYLARDWPVMLARMEQHRITMARAPLNAVQRAAIDAFVQELSTGNPLRGSSHDAATLPRPGAVITDDAPGRWLSLVFFFGLAALGAWRWAGTWVRREC
jgi:cytochrome c5